MEQSITRSMDTNATMAAAFDCKQSVGVHTFQAKIINTTVSFQVIKLNDSFHLFVGTKPTLENMAMAMKNNYENLPVTAHLFGSSLDSTSSSIAQKLAKKTGKQVFVSCNLDYDPTLLPLVEKHIFEELKKNPDKF